MIRVCFFGFLFSNLFFSKPVQNFFPWSLSIYSHRNSIILDDHENVLWYCFSYFSFQSFLYFFQSLRQCHIGYPRNTFLLIFFFKFISYKMFVVILISLWGAVSHWVLWNIFIENVFLKNSPQYFLIFYYYYYYYFSFFDKLFLFFHCKRQFHIGSTQNTIPGFFYFFF